MTLAIASFTAAASSIVFDASPVAIASSLKDAAASLSSYQTADYAGAKPGQNRPQICQTALPAVGMSDATRAMGLQVEG